METNASDVSATGPYLSARIAVDLSTVRCPLFYLTLALMLATLVNGRGAALGIALVVQWSGRMGLIAQPMEKYAPRLDLVLPWPALTNAGNADPLPGTWRRVSRSCGYRDQCDRRLWG